VAPNLLIRAIRAMGVTKSKQSTTAIQLERMKAVKEQLEAAIVEHRRMRDELAALEQRHPLDSLRSALRRQFRRLRGSTRS
jgi:hypothetical protein